MSVTPEQPSRNNKIMAESKLSAAITAVLTVRRSPQSCVLEPMENRTLLSGVSFLGPAQSYPVAGGQGYPVFAQVNGDGNTEVIAGYQRTYGNELAGRITTIVPNTDGSILASPFPTVYNVVDIGNTTNIVTTNQSSNSTSTNGPNFANTPDGLLTFVAGVNGDGTPDVVLVKDAYTAVVTTTTTIITSNTGSNSSSTSTTTTSNTSTVTMYYGPTIEVLAGSAGTTTNGHYSAGPFTVGQTIHLQNNPGNKPGTLALVDLNGDGSPDLVLGYFYNNSIAVLPSASGGTFATTPLPRVAVGRGPDAIAYGQLMGANSPEDIVVANKLDGTISVLIGQDNGQFLPQHVYKVGNDPTSVAIADLTGDGVNDIVVTNAGDNTVSVLMGNPEGSGNGLGTFQPAQTFATGPGPVSVHVADLNGDGFSDLVTANATGDSVSVLLGNGNGTFQAHQDVALGVSPASIATGSATSVSVSAPNVSALAEVRQDIFVAATGASTNNPNAVYGSQVLVLPNINTNQPGFSLQAGVLTLTGTTGNDTISLTVSEGNVNAQIDDLTKTYPIASVGQADIAGLAGNDSITFDSSVTFPVNAGGQGGNDTIVASNASNDSLSGGAGADSLVGGSGNNFITGGAGNDTLVAGSGNDTLRGGVGNDSLNGRGGGNDLLSGGQGSDSLLGTLVSGSDTDTLIGGAGSDSIVAGPRDSKVLAGPGGDDTIVGP